MAAAAVKAGTHGRRGVWRKAESGHRSLSETDAPISHFPGLGVPPEVASAATTLFAGAHPLDRTATQARLAGTDRVLKHRRTVRLGIAGHLSDPNKQDAGGTCQSGHGSIRIVTWKGLHSISFLRRLGHLVDPARACDLPLEAARPRARLPALDQRGEKVGPVLEDHL